MPVGNVVLFIVAVALSAMCSGVELAYMSANRLRIEIDRDKRTLSSWIIQRYLRHPGLFIAAILVGNNVALVVYGMLMNQLLAPVVLPLAAYGDTVVLITETVISTMCILLVGEFLPKVFSSMHPNAFLRIFSFPAYLIYVAFYPLSLFMSWISSRFIKAITKKEIPSENAGLTFGRTDLNVLVEQAASQKDDEESEDHVNEHELKIFRNVLDFDNVKLRDCLVPRMDIEALDVENTVEDLRALFVKTKFSRIPVYEESIDNIVGYVNAKTLFKRPKTIREVVLPLRYVPESMKAGTLLTQFIKSSSSMAIVVDEFGGTAGLVTIEDLLEEIFGEIYDEHDLTTLVIRQLDENTYRFSGRAEVEEINERFGLGIPESESYDTIAGFILDQHPDIPSAGDEIEIGKFKFCIERVDASRIRLVRLEVED